MKLQLLLSWLDGLCPALPDGLELETLDVAPRPAPLVIPDKLWDGGADPNHLERQRWGLVVPLGVEGERLLNLIEPLRKVRQDGQGGALVRVYRVSPGMDEQRARHWRRRILFDEQTAGLDRCRYLLILGDLNQVSLEFQQVLSMDAFVGRLAFASDEGYAAYVSKVLRWEQTSAHDSKPRLLVYTSRDHSDATEQGHRMLISPGIESCRKLQRQGRLPASDIVELDGSAQCPGEDLLAHAVQPMPSVLFTLSHGLGVFPAGVERQRTLQGALVLPNGQPLKTEAVASGPFLPGGVWFCFACFSAGTPAQSTYMPWLQLLKGTNRELDHVLASLPRDVQRPFIAAQPQAALANPEGPLAVMGHVDLAWSYGFNEQGVGTPSRFFEVLRSLLEGRRAGVALHHLLSSANDAGNELALLYKQDDVARAAKQHSPVHHRERAIAWMKRQDLAGYILLGDPAVRIVRGAG